MSDHWKSVNLGGKLSDKVRTRIYFKVCGTMLRVFVFTSVVALVFAASSGTLNLGTTQTNNAGNFFMTWALCNSSNVYCK